MQVTLRSISTIDLIRQQHLSRTYSYATPMSGDVVCRLRLLVLVTPQRILQISSLQGLGGHACEP
jgi:hypothetical protein